MQYYNKINIKSIKDLVTKKAKYQKVVILFDGDTDLDLLNNIEMQIKDDVLLFSYNLEHALDSDIKSFLLDGTRCVIILLNDCNYIKMSDFYDFNTMIIDVFSGKILSAHLQKCEEYYLFYEDNTLSIEDHLLMCNILIEWKWQNLLSSKNYNHEEEIMMSTFSRKDLLNCEYFYNTEIVKELINIDYNNYQLYLLIRVIAIKYLFLTFLESSQFMIDVYKNYSNNLDEINHVYKLYKDERANFVLKNCNKLMLDFISVALSSVKCKWGWKVEEINKILKNIKIKAKNNKKDNLLKYCFLYGIFEKI